MNIIKNTNNKTAPSKGMSWKWQITIFVLLNVFVIAVYVLRFTGVEFDQYFMYAFPAMSITAIILAIKYRNVPQAKPVGTEDVAAWAQSKGYSFSPPSRNNERIKALLTDSSMKSYFDFKNVFLQHKEPFKGYWHAEGNEDGRKVQVFSTNCGWCVEVQTNQVPVFVRVMHKFFGADDTMDVESGSFENRYDLNVKREGAVLQLLDPVMIESLDKSHISGIEFGDSSVVLYLTVINNIGDFDWMVEWGLKIAHQVDHNFPLGKYEKN